MLTAMNCDNNVNKKIIRSTINKYQKENNYIPIRSSSIDIKTERNRYKLIRLRDDQYIDLYQYSIGIKEDYRHFMALLRSDDLIYSSLSKMYATLKKLFGESGKCYDNWKCSFSFPFLIKFQKKFSEIDYLLNVMDVKGAVELIFYKLIHEDDKRYERKDIIYEPFEEFPEDEMIYFMNFFTGYLSGAFNCIGGRHNDFFFKTVLSSNIVYGYKDGIFFDKRFENEESLEIFTDQLRR